jgi:hypothetical protein
MIRAGDVIRVWDYEFMVVFDGRQSLIGEAALIKNSSLTNLNAGEAVAFRIQKRPTLQKTHKEMHSKCDTGSDIPGGGAQ